MKAALAEQAFDIVLADNRLPHFDAIGALAVLKESGLDIPLIVVTGTMGDEAAVELVKAGADDYVLKDSMLRLPVVVERALTALEERLKRRQAEEKLRQSEADFRALAESMPQIVWACHPDGANYYFNHQWVDYTGLTLEESYGAGWNTPFHPDDQQRAWEAWQNSTHNYVPYSLQCRLRRADGVYRWWLTRGVPLRNADGKVLKWFGTCTDIEEVKETQAALEHQARLLELSHDAILVWEWNGAITFWNHGAESTYGFPAAEAVGRVSHDLLQTHFPQGFASFQQELERAGAWAGELTQIQRDGHPITVESQCQVVHLSDGRRLVLETNRDVTMRKWAEEERLSLEHRLAESQKLESLGQLAGGIAHDFNNLLTAILGYSDLILASGPSTVDEVRPDLEEIKRAGERARVLTQQILAFSRRQALRPQVVLLDKIIRGTEPLLRRTIGEDIDLQIIDSPGLPPVEVDPHQFEQVVINLVLNARDAMPSGGHLTIETGTVELDEEFCRIHVGATPGSYLMLRVSDTGVGMDAATQECIFEPFFTTKAVGAGTGLGLATVYGIVKQSNGTIFATSEPGQGSSFAIYLPQAAQPEVPKELPIPPQARAGGRGTILVVEDEEALCSLIERILAGVGYKTVIFSSAQEALAALEQGTSSFDMLLTDVMLPGPIQGHDLAQTILASRPHLPVLFISGYARDALVHSGRLDESVNLLEKPFSPDSLRDMVRRVLDLPRESG
jgi:PAS domain S-box-containing protein